MRRRTGIVVAAAVASALWASQSVMAQAPPQADAAASASASDGGAGQAAPAADAVDLGVVYGPGGYPVGCIGREYGSPDLFYNYYTQGWCNAVNAQMYLAPRPVPPYVGHTFYTYQPFYPHEMMYTHKNRYHNVYDNGRGLNRTKVSYRPSAHQLLRDAYFNFRIPR